MRIWPLLFILATPSVAAAELWVEDSLELLVCRADDIVWAKVTATSQQPAKVTMKVEQSLKGSSAQQGASLEQPTFASSSHNVGDHVLLFFTNQPPNHAPPSSLPAPLTYAIHLQASGENFYNVDKHSRGIPDRDFVLHKTQQQLTSAIAKTVAQQSKSPCDSSKTGWIDSPYESELFSSRYGGSAVMLIVLADSHYLSRAMTLLAKNDAFSKGTAIGMLVHFDTPKHRAIVKAALKSKDDYVRQTAQGVLKEWREKNAK